MIDNHMRQSKGNVTYKGDKSQLEIIRSILIENRVVTERDVKPYKIGRDSFASCISRLRTTMNIEADHIKRERKPRPTNVGTGVMRETQSPL